MITRPTSPRPIARVPEPRMPYMPPGPARILAALKPWRHVLKRGSAELLAFSRWTDLQSVTDPRRLDDEVTARIMKAESRPFLIGPVTAHDRLDELPGDRPGAPALRPLWMPPAGVEGRAPRSGASRP